MIWHSSNIIGVTQTVKPSRITFKRPYLIYLNYLLRVFCPGNSLFSLPIFSTPTRTDGLSLPPEVVWHPSCSIFLSQEYFLPCEVFFQFVTHRSRRRLCTVTVWGIPGDGPSLWLVIEFGFYDERRFFKGDLSYFLFTCDLFTPSFRIVDMEEVVTR